MFYALPDLSFILFANSWDIVRHEYIRGLIVGVLRVRPSARHPLTLDLVQQSDVLIELHESQEGDEFAHDRLLEVSLYAEVSLNDSRVKDFHLLLSELIVIVHLYSERVLIRIVIQVDEAVVEKETRVALFAIRVIDLITSWDVFKGLNDETCAIICVGPTSLARSLVV